MSLEKLDFSGSEGHDRTAIHEGAGITFVFEPRPALLIDPP
jgi:hypothetical protein